MKREDKLKRLIQQVTHDAPAVDFTQQVLHELKTGAVESTVGNEALAALVKRVPAGNPSPVFTSNVMQHVNAAESSLAVKPIISKRAWYLVAAALVFLVLFVGLSDQNTVSKGTANYVMYMGGLISVMLQQIAAIPYLYALTFLSICVLLLGDYLLKSRKSQNHTA